MDLVTSRSPDAERLLELLRERSFQKKKVILASGRESDFFIDCKQTVLGAEAHTLVGRLMLERAQSFGDVRAVAGVELGGCPLASAVAFASHQAGVGLDAVYVRKTVKDHGSRRELEGDTLLPDGSGIVVLEDVVTTGGSTLDAVRKLRARRLAVRGVVAIIDRLEGGRDAIEQAGLPFAALYTRHDFIPE